MTYLIDKDGDALEKAAGTFIKEHLINYEKVWQLYIGHDGLGQRAKMPMYDKEDMRQSFSEHTYTMLESLFSVFRIAQRDFVDIYSKDAIDKYLEVIDLYLLFYAHIGRARDNIYEACSVIGLPNLSDVEQMLDAAYTARHIVLHGKKLPLLFKDGKIEVPSLKTSDNVNGKWDNKDNQMTWDVVNQIPTAELKSSLMEAFYTFCAQMNTVLGYCHKHLEKSIQGRFKLIFSSAPATEDALALAVSGTTYVPTLSVVVRKKRK